MFIAIHQSCVSTLFVDRYKVMFLCFSKSVEESDKVFFFICSRTINIYVYNALA